MKRAASPPLDKLPKKRKLRKTIGLVYEKEEQRRSVCRHEKDRKKARNDRNIETKGMLQTHLSYIKEYDKDMPEAPYTSLHHILHHRSRHSSNWCSCSVMSNTLRDLLPTSLFHSIRKRTPSSSKIGSIKSDGNIYSSNEHCLESKASAPAESCLSPDQRVERKYAEEKKWNLNFKTSITDVNSLEARGKITKAYVRNKNRKPFLEDGRLDLYHLHLLADTAINLGSERNDEHASTSGAASVIQKNLHSKKEVSPKGHLSTEIHHKEFLAEHINIDDESIADKKDIDLKRDFEYSKEQFPAFASMDSVSHGKFFPDWCCLEPCNTNQKNSNSTILRCMEKPQKSEGYPSSLNEKTLLARTVENSQMSKGLPNSFNTNYLIDQSPGSHVTGIVQRCKQKATSMVDVALKVMSSLKDGENAYVMIGEALDAAMIGQVGVDSRIWGLQNCSYSQNAGLGSCLQDAPSKLISAGVAALLMIQACNHTRLPPADAMAIIEHAARDLQPHCSQNLHIYREIKELMGVIKTQILTLVRIPSSNLQVLLSKIL